MLSYLIDQVYLLYRLAVAPTHFVRVFCFLRPKKRENETRNKLKIPRCKKVVDTFLGAVSYNILKYAPTML